MALHTVLLSVTNVLEYWNASTVCIITSASTVLVFRFEIIEMLIVISTLYMYSLDSLLE